MVLVTGRYRRRGLATPLMRRAMDDLAQSRLVPVLDATPDGRAVYRALGFEDSWGFHRLKRRERHTTGDTPTVPAGTSIRPIADGIGRRSAPTTRAAFGARPRRAC